jgi:hypothetical protein
MISPMPADANAFAKLLIWTTQMHD